MKKILKDNPSNHEARISIARLEPLAREKFEKMKEEALGKIPDCISMLIVTLLVLFVLSKLYVFVYEPRVVLTLTSHIRLS